MSASVKYDWAVVCCDDANALLTMGGKELNTWQLVWMTITHSA